MTENSYDFVVSSFVKRNPGINRKLYQFWSLREFCITENSYDFVLSSFVKRNPFFLKLWTKNNQWNE